MGDPVKLHAIDAQQLRMARRDAVGELPADWWPAIDAEARQARPAWNGATGHPAAQRDVWRGWLDRYGGAAAADLTDSQIKAQAHAYALEARSMDIGEFMARPWAEFARLIVLAEAIRRDNEERPQHGAAPGVGTCGEAEQVLRDLTALASEVTDHTPDSFRRAVLRLAQRARGVSASDGQPEPRQVP